MPQPGFFEIYPSARPPLPAGTYTATAHLDLEAAPPKPATGAIPVDDAQFYVHLVSPRYVMPLYCRRRFCLRSTCGGFKGGSPATRSCICSRRARRCSSSTTAST